MNRRSLLFVLCAVASMGLVSGCSAGDAGDARSGSTPAATATPTAAAWPDGADDATPSCQDASAATVSIVNDALRSTAAADGSVDTVLPWLSARPDRELGVWTLTGLVQNAQTATGTEGGYFAVWATDLDPTAADFAGQVYTVGSSSASITHLDPLLPAYVGSSDMEDVPAAALRCGGDRASQQ